MKDIIQIEENPWVKVIPEEYDGHMSSPSVNQSGFLSDCFKEVLVRYNPSDIAIVGCGTGNGLEHIDSSYTKRTTVIDINSDFLDNLKNRYHTTIPGLEVIHKDLCTCELSGDYSLIFAALVFEFLKPEILLQKISQWLNLGGIFRVVLQRPNVTLPEVSETKYKSLKELKNIVNLIDLDFFRRESAGLGLIEIDSRVTTLQSGKSFYIGTFQKKG